jgi:CRP-like cAMP-binding protein
LATILRILHKNHNKYEECIVREGDPGIAMYILVEGTASYTKGSKWMPEELIESKRAVLPKAPELSPGSSFGEEILFGFTESYSYTIVSTCHHCEFHSISEDDFTHFFRNMPELHDRMLDNFMRSRGVRTEGVRTETGSLGSLRGSMRPSLRPSTMQVMENVLPNS